MGHVQHLSLTYTCNVLAPTTKLYIQKCMSKSYITGKEQKRKKKNLETSDQPTGIELTIYRCSARLIGLS